MSTTSRFLKINIKKIATLAVKSYSKAESCINMCVVVYLNPSATCDLTTQTSMKSCNNFQRLESNR